MVNSQRGACVLTSEEHTAPKSRQNNRKPKRCPQKGGKNTKEEQQNYSEQESADMNLFKKADNSFDEQIPRGSDSCVMYVFTHRYKIPLFKNMIVKLHVWPEASSVTGEL